MKKEDILGTFLYLIMLGIGAIYIFVILVQRASASGLGELYFLYNLGAFIAGIVFNALIFELGHVIGAKIGGYKVVFVSVLGLTLKKEGEKWKFCFAEFGGLVGETKITPNRDDPDKCDPFPYLTFGSLLYAAELIFVLLFFFINKNELGPISNVAYFFLTMGVLGFTFFLYNIIPAKLDCKTDGYVFRLLSNKKNKEAYNELLRVDYELSQGNKVEIKTFENITNFTASLNMNKFYFLVNDGDVEEAEKLIDKIMSEQKNISYDVYLKAKEEKIYIDCINLAPEEIKDYVEKNTSISERHDIAYDKGMSAIRGYILISGFYDKSRSECLVALNKLNKALKRTPKMMKNIEINLFNNLMKKLCEIHPKWELEKYIISTEKIG